MRPNFKQRSHNVDSGFSDASSASLVSSRVFRGSRRPKKSKRGSNGTGSNEKSNKKRIAESLTPSAPLFLTRQQWATQWVILVFFNADSNPPSFRLQSTDGKISQTNAPRDDRSFKLNNNNESQWIEDEVSTVCTSDSTVSDLNVINLSSYKLSLVETQVLARGLSFCPNQNLDKFEVIKDLQLFARKLILKQLYSQDIPVKPDFELQELRALETLIDLLEESDPPRPDRSDRSWTSSGELRSEWATLVAQDHL